VRFEVFTAKIQVDFWVVTLNVEAARSSKILVSYPEDLDLKVKKDICI
jgi:hypothetical protein